MAQVIVCNLEDEVAASLKLKGEAQRAFARAGAA